MGDHGHGHQELSPSQRQDGLLSTTLLPHEPWEERWTRIVVDEGMKQRLRNYALFSLAARANLSTIGLPSHGLVLLSGPPGTGKTSLAQGLAHEAAGALVDQGTSDGVIFAVIDPHAFPAEMLGATQRAVARMFDRVIPDLAGRGKPVIVLLDEVEALAVSRARASFDTNPVDVHRATDAVLTGIDKSAELYRNVLFVATTNDLRSVDEAFLSRVDVHEHVGLPSSDAIAAILRDTLAEVAEQTFDDAALQVVAKRCEEAQMDARQIRKLVLRAIISGGPELALAPEKVDLNQVAAQLG
jgi:SpoVK/Ycf46/Vps4 family AAA+-type ATPase